MHRVPPSPLIIDGFTACRMKSTCDFFEDRSFIEGRRGVKMVRGIELSFTPKKKGGGTGEKF